MFESMAVPEGAEAKSEPINMLPEPPVAVGIDIGAAAGAMGAGAAGAAGAVVGAALAGARLESPEVGPVVELDAEALVPVALDEEALPPVALDVLEAVDELEELDVDAEPEEFEFDEDDESPDPLSDLPLSLSVAGARGSLLEGPEVVASTFVSWSNFANCSLGKVLGTPGAEFPEISAIFPGVTETAL